MQRLERLQPDEHTTPCYHPGGITQAHQFIDLRLKELAMHELHMRSALEPDARLAPASLPSLLRPIDGSIASGSMRWGFRAGPPLAAPVRYRFAVSGPLAYQTDLVVTGDSMQQEVSSNASPAVTFRCDTETFVLLIAGHLPLQTALQDGRIAAEGDEADITDCAQWFQSI